MIKHYRSIFLHHTKKTPEIKRNLSGYWRFKRDIFALAAGMDTNTDFVKINTLLNAVGPEVVEISDTLELAAIERATYVSVTFENVCSARKNTGYERCVFYQRNQKERGNLIHFSLT